MFFPIGWTEYTATVNGQVLKLVPCENCATEYVYVLKRESSGTTGGKSGTNRLASDVEDTVRQYLANDFDPVPCPVCGHYQRYMFPKLMQTGCLWGVVAPGVVLVATGLATIGALVRTLEYLSQPSDQALWRLARSCAALVVAGLIGGVLWAGQRSRIRNFDPNSEDPQARIARGRERAITRAQFEAGQHPGS